MIEKKKKLTLVLIALVLFCGVVMPFLSSDVATATTIQELEEKALYNGLATCYSGNYTKSEISSNVAADVLNMMTDSGKKDKVIDLPSLSGLESVTCQTLLKRLASKRSIDSYTNIGYHEESTGAGTSERCVSIAYTHEYRGNDNREHKDDYVTNELCFDVGEDKRIISAKAGSETSGPLELKAYYTDPNYPSTLYQITVIDKNKSGEDQTLVHDMNYINAEWSTSDISNVFRRIGTASGGSYVYRNTGIEWKGDKQKYVKDGVTVAATKALQYFTSNGNAAFSSYTYTDQYDLTMEYVNAALKAGTATLGDSSQCSESLETAKSNSDDGLAIRDGDKWCPITITDGKSYGTVLAGTKTVKNKSLTEMVRGMMNTAFYNGLESENTQPATFQNGQFTAGVTNSPAGTPAGSNSNSDLPVCSQNTGVLSWIMCPVLRFAGQATSNVYEWIESSFLAVPSSFLSTDSGTYRGWSTFRNMANIIFAIAFIVVIFSQVTGIGISNYGIKKMLPRLIMVVVLVNISFILCQLAVDLSNIAGSQLNIILRGLSDVAFDPSQIGEMTNVLVDGGGNTSGGNNTISNVLGVSGLVIGVLTASSWIPMLLLTLLGALVSVLFFFVILGIRQAGVLIAIVLSPLAVVCYALPNTKSLFDRWKKLFVGVLTVYPICGALMGGGLFAAKLMMENAQNVEDGFKFMYVIIAMLMTFLPFFMVPKLLQKSLEGLGNVGAAIAGYGSKTQKKATKAVGNSEGFRDMQRQLKYTSAGLAAARGRALNNLGKRVGSVGSKIGGVVGRSPVGRLASGISGGISGYANGTGSNVADKAARTALRGAGKVLKGAGAVATAPVRAVGQAARRNYARNERLVTARRNEQRFADNIESQLADEDARAENQNVQAMRTLMREGKVRGDDGNIIDITDEDSLGRAYDVALSALEDDPEDNDAKVRVRALQSYLMTTDPGKEMMKSVLSEHVHAERNNLDNRDNNVADIERRRDAYRRATESLDVGSIKKEDKQFAGMIGVLQGRSMSQFKDLHDAGMRSYSDGKKKRSYSLYGFGKSGADYKPENWHGLSDSAYESLIGAVENGEVGDTQLRDMVASLNQAINDPTLSKDMKNTKTMGYANRLLSASYARGAVPHGTSNVPTAGSDYLKRSSVDDVKHMASFISGVGADDLMPVPKPHDTPEQRAAAQTKAQRLRTQIQHMAENARLTLESGEEMSQDKADALNSIITAAGQKQIGTDASGNPEYLKDISGQKFQPIAASSATYKIHGAPQQQQLPELNKDWFQETSSHFNRSGQRVQKQVWKTRIRDASGALTGAERELTPDEIRDAESIMAVREEKRRENIRNGFSPDPNNSSNP